MFRAGILDSRGRDGSCSLQTRRRHARQRIGAVGRFTGKPKRTSCVMATNRVTAMGCRSAVANINGPIAQAVKIAKIESQEQLDTPHRLDGTPSNPPRANAIFAHVIRSPAPPRAAAVPLYQHLAL